jgi:hypothetical protein
LFSPRWCGDQRCDEDWCRSIIIEPIREKSFPWAECGVEYVQFEIPGRGRRFGFVAGEIVHDLTAHRADMLSLYDAFQAADAAHRPLPEFVRSLIPQDSQAVLNRHALFGGLPGEDGPFVVPPLDHADPHRVLVSGTGLTHTGSMESRDQMHTAQKNEHATAPAPQTDSARMFEAGLKGGKPQPGRRGTAPEWFYKGDGGIVRGHRAALEIPPFALDGGEEPEIVGCYIIDSTGQPRRIGFALGNEWSDHATEAISYLHLAPSKLRTCAIGPTILSDWDFQDAALRCDVKRAGRTIYDSGELRAGEKWMCHALRNLEDHHFKYRQHRRPGDIHLHFFGTSKLSYKTRDWRFQAGDEIRIESPAFAGPLVNTVAGGPETDEKPVAVVPA